MGEAGLPVSIAGAVAAGGAAASAACLPPPLAMPPPSPCLLPHPPTMRAGEAVAAWQREGVLHVQAAVLLLLGRP